MDRRDFSPRDEPWTAPTELSVSKPRPLKSTGAATASVVVGCVYVCIVLAIALAAFGWARRADLLQREGTEADAVVTRTWTESRTAMVAYEFSAGGHTVRGEHTIPKSRQAALTTGAHTPVQYARSDPGINRPAVSSDPPLTYWMAFLVFVGSMALVALVVLPIRKERRLLRYGEAAAGVITNNPQGRLPKYGYVLKYEFQLPDGSPVNGRTQRDARCRNGEIVCVLYDPARPRRNDLYPTRLWRIRL